MRSIHFRHEAQGFTLVELMIVVAIIALIAAIAIPNLVRARATANETAAIGNMRTLASALESYRAGQSPPTYPANTKVLSDAIPPYVTAVLTSASGAVTRQGYGFTYTQGSASTYGLVAAPTSTATGTRSFFVDESGVLRSGTTNGGTQLE